MTRPRRPGEPRSPRPAAFPREAATHQTMRPNRSRNSVMEGPEPLPRTPRPTGMRQAPCIAVVAACASAMLFSGCGGAGTAGHPLERVQIVARESPSTPACQAGRRCERPFHGRFALITADGHRTEIATDTRGRAILDIPAGTYRVTTVQAHPLPRLTAAIVAGRSIRAANGRVAVQVRAVDTQVVTLVFDTGIR